MCFLTWFGALKFGQIYSKIHRSPLAVFFIAFHFSMENNGQSLTSTISLKMNQGSKQL